MHNFAQFVCYCASGENADNPGTYMAKRETYIKALRVCLLGLVAFDLVIMVPALVFPGWVIDLGSLNSGSIAGAPYRAGQIEPLFLRGVGILWLLAAYVQYVAWRDPVNRLLAVNIAIVFRFCGGTFELIVILFLLPAAGFNDPLIYWVLGSFVAGDYIMIGIMVYLLHKAELHWWRGVLH